MKIDDQLTALEALREKYRAERDKRIRPEGNRQYGYIGTGKFENYGADPWTPQVEERATVHDDVDLTILGGGFGGLIAGAFARKAGIDKIRFIDTAGDFGGTWYWNRYPGLACDVESYIYLPLLEEVGTMPSRKYVSGEEIRQHALAIAEHFNLRRDTLFQTKIESVNWDDDRELWTVTTSRGDRFDSRYVLVSGGVLQRPKLPNLPGVEDFAGHAFHTSRWDYDYTGGDHTGGLHKLADKRVAIVGTGATALQVVPHLAEHAKELLVVQRTPSTVDVRADAETDRQWWESLEPGWQNERRKNFIDIVHGQGAEQNLVGDSWTDIGPARGMRRLIDSGFSEDPAVAFELADFEKMEELRRRVTDLVEDPDTAARLQPWYMHMCKRPGFSDRYLQTFNKPHVSLVDTEGQGIERFTAKGFVANGIEHEVDLIIFATGYEVSFDPATRAGVEIRGRKGVPLPEYWADGMRTLHGWVTRGYPNLFHMGVLQNAYSVNYTHILEQQAAHIMTAVTEAERRGDVLVEPSEESESEWVATIRAQGPAQDEFNAECTPGYYNSEGKPPRTETLAAGPNEFDRILAEWLATGGLEEVMEPKSQA
ncbi:flavin-containing monooxygenase [Rhodococcus aetherivorans]